MVFSVWQLLFNGMNGLRARLNKSAARVAGIYLLAAVVWIVLTDLGALQVVLDPIALTSLQTAKGLMFVTVSAGLLYVLIAREHRRLSNTNEELELALRHASVLHRLLRHNLRNSCDVVLNNVELLRANKTDETAAYDRIERQAEALSAIAEKSRHLRDLVLAEEPSVCNLDLGVVVSDQVATVRDEFQAGDISVEISSHSEALAHPRIGIGIEELLRNAIIHGNPAETSVAVSVFETDDTVTVQVEDGGPGLPPMERAVLEGSTEEPLEHSRGIGLWLVQFLVARSDGSVSTSDREPTGSTIRLQFQRAD